MMFYQYLKKHVKKSQLILIGMGLFLIIIGFLSWNFYFSKLYLFQENEKKFLEAVQEYYRENPLYLPKENMIKSITLEELYLESRVETLTVPKSNKLCNTDSWVRVYNDHEKYTYYVYLSCGKYESQIDHEGPEIILNGDSTIYVSLGREYEELGVKEVIDKKDGKIDTSQVMIDSSRVNTKKAGTYQVIYTVRDQLNNQTKITREVVVTRNLTDTIIDQTDESNYFKGGEVNNNYLLFSGMLFRIIGVKEDGTVLVISDELLNNLRINSTEYENSNVDQFLTNYFLPKLYSQDKIVEASYCVGEIANKNDFSNSCSKTITRKIAALSIDELQKTFLNQESFLCSNFSYSLTNYMEGKNLNAFGYENDCLDVIDETEFELPAIRPVLTLEKDIKIIGGNGTKTNPYKLDDYSYAKTQDEIKTRLIGEYVNYSGMTFRIIDQIDGNTRLIATNAMQKNLSETASMEFLDLVVPENTHYQFNLDEKNNPGDLLNHSYLDYINTNAIITSEYEIPTNDATKIYSNYEIKKIKAKMVLPKTYDLFAAVQSMNSSTMYLYLDTSVKEKQVFDINVINGKIFDEEMNIWGPYRFKPVITISGNLKIKSGSGTVNSPYYIG